MKTNKVELHNKHKDAKHYHPVTMMCYRKTDYGFKFLRGCKLNAFASGGVIEVWIPSGMKKGFVPL